MANDVPLGLADQSLSVKIYEELRERIIEGTLAAGERIRERELAAEFNVSRIPIREAMPRLEAEGFIKTLPRRGAVVTEMTLNDVEEEERTWHRGPFGKRRNLVYKIPFPCFARSGAT